MTTQTSIIEDNTSEEKLAAGMVLTDSEKDVLGEVGNICMGTSATTLSTLLGKRVTITTPKVSVCKGKEFFNEYDKPIVVAEVSYVEGIDGENIFLIKKEDALLITGLLMGSEDTSTEEELLEFYLSAMSEVMNQMVGSSATAMADILHRQINISPPIVKEVLLGDEHDEHLQQEKIFVRISFRMEIEGLLVSNIMNLMPFEFAKKLVKLMMGEDDERTPDVQEPAAVTAKPDSNRNDITKPRPVAEIKDNKKVELKTVKYQSFNNANDTRYLGENPDSPKSIDLIMDVPLQVTVVLGKSKKSIKEILDIGKGSIIVLDRIAGEMVDVLVNGKLFARGEVVVIDDNYGVRITELSTPEYSSDADERNSKNVILGMAGEG